MSFIRPDALAALNKWREVLIGAGLFALGLWAMTGHGLLPWIGVALALIGAGLGLAALQRLRFHATGGGMGVVHVDEGQVGYYGPLSGGIVELSEISALALDRDNYPPTWVLSQPGQEDLVIPLDAEGADALFDVFASLPGIRTERLLSQMQQGGEGCLTIWTRAGRAVPGDRKPRLRLH